MRSVMQHSFANVPRADIPRSSFNRSHGLKTTFDCDYLIPILVDDIIPGDSLSLDANFFARLASPTVLPLLDSLFLETFFFFVPYRLVWDNWEKFCGAQDNPADSIDYTIPAIGVATTYNLQANGEIFQYMGLPWVSSADVSEISALPFRAYNLIWNEWFRDQNLQDSVSVSTDDGPDGAATEYSLLKRGKRHDYITSCLPSPQKGDAVDLPLGSTAPITTITGISAGAKVLVQDRDTSGDVWELDVGASGQLEYDANLTTAHNLEADLTNATAATINDLRLAFQTQRLLERDARSGTRYVETILAHFGVTVPDFRVQRPEYLGGGSSPIQMNQIAQTTYQGTQTIEDAKGALSSIGHVSGKHGFTKSFVEHGVLIGLANVRGDITYSQGLDRYWSKSTRYDFYYPVLSQIGEQSVLNSEVFYQNAAADDNVFGYQERYAEYRFKNSRLSGLMMVDRASNLDEFHLSEDFASLPTLDDSFIQSNTGSPLDRAISVPSQPHFVADFYFDMKHARPLPLYGVPGNLDHF